MMKVFERYMVTTPDGQTYEVQIRGDTSKMPYQFDYFFPDTDKLVKTISCSTQDSMRDFAKQHAAPPNSIWKLIEQR